MKAIYRTGIVSIKWFPKHLETREALFALFDLSERYLDLNQYVCFIDYNKAFNKIRHQHLVEILLKNEIYLREIQVIFNLCNWQKEDRGKKDMTSKGI